jgi:16S rRNA (adenine1518-N6/adenine1519-N6)-dimethyltransferase
MEKEKLQNFLKNHGLRPNFTYGQNFLLDEAVLETMLQTAEVKPADRVLEIGPGIGNLTRLLCERGAEVLAVEKDPKFLPLLKSIKKDFPDLHFEIADALEYDFQKYFLEQTPNRAGGFKVIANIPYFVTGKILQMLMTARVKPRSITVLVQKEVAQRVAAKPGKMSVLAVSVQLYGRPSLVKIVPARSFYPAPEVDSAILHIELFEKPPYEVPDEKKFFSLVKACFIGKRKQLHNTLTNFLQGDKVLAEKILQQASIHPQARPQDLSVKDWVSLCQQI